MTKAELEEELARAEAVNRELRADRDAWKNARLADDEAEAIAGCVKALDQMRSARSSRSNNTVFYSYSGDEPMRRVLKFLAARYGVEWPAPPPPEPAPFDPHAVVEAIVDYQRRNGNWRADGRTF